MKIENNQKTQDMTEKCSTSRHAENLKTEQTKSINSIDKQRQMWERDNHSRRKNEYQTAWKTI